jgi:hypothetical protein
MLSASVHVLVLWLQQKCDESEDELHGARVRAAVLCSEREKDTVMVMRKVVASYFGIVKNTMKDLVPKVIMRFVVSHTADMIHGHLIAKILRCALCPPPLPGSVTCVAKMTVIRTCHSAWLCSGDEKDVMRERADVAHRRAELSVTCDVLAKAVAQLQLIPRELETSGGGPAWHNGVSPRDPMPIVRRSNMDVYNGRPR